jgi:hypothetical protein
MEPNQIDEAMKARLDSRAGKIPNWLAIAV